MSTPANGRRLAASTSPYLLQHAGNPVDWWPWGEEAFREAVRRDVPVFLSIGYSTCYWCHVMERESFEHEPTGRMLSERFVCVKVDREERPDVDEAYMAATLVLTGRGGWPMTVFVEPRTRRPFYCGTYFPAQPREGVPTLEKVCEAMSGAWRQQREGVEQQAAAVADAVRDHLAPSGEPAELGQAQVADAVSALLRTHDRTHGGFGGAPKFPQPPVLEFLLDVRTRAADDATGDAIDLTLRATLDAIVRGSLRDHVGGGFHRYCVDESWTIPHFEKMLTDQAGLLRVLARAARLYGDEEYRRAAIELVGYVSREMTLPEGGFASAQDAEVAGREGDNYLWTPQSLRDALAPDALRDSPALLEAGLEATRFAATVYGLDGPPNFRDPHHPGEPARWVLRLSARPERLAAPLQLAPAAFVQRLQHLNAALLEARALRPQPALDDKAVTAWNGAMIASLAIAARELEAPELLEPARRAMRFVEAHLQDGPDDLRRVWCRGRAHTAGFLEDFAWTIAACVELARHEPEPARGELLARASALAGAAATRFATPNGAWHDAREDSGDAALFVRGLATHDGAGPSGLSTFVHALLDLAEASGDREHAGRALGTLTSISARLAAAPVACVNSTRALFRLLIAGESPLGPDRPTSADELPASPADSAGVVQVFASGDRVTLDVQHPGEVHLAVRVAPGWHVAAADPGGSSAARALTPFRVGILGGEGVRAYADYPQGKPFGVRGREIHGYEGEFPLRVALERVGPVTGRPILVVTFQACSDRECLTPGVVELDIAIDAL